MKRIQKQSICCLVALALPFLFGCSGPEPQAAELQPASQSKPSAATAPVEQSAPTKPTEHRAPTLEEAREAVARSGQDSFVLQGRQFVAGDFNGDDSQDIAVVVKPARNMLGRINNEYAIWKLEDPHNVAAPDLSAPVRRVRYVARKVFANDDELLMMIIHGTGEKGWRGKVVNGIYLLKNATGADIRLQTLKESLAASSKKKSTAILKGDVIRQTLDGQSGFLFWTGAQYAWRAVG